MSILIFIIILVALILVHEFGHFLVAKRTGMKVEEFGIGFPPRLFMWKKGETEYTINALPFGGFVRIFGEDPEEASTNPHDAPRSFSARPRLEQALVVAAGVVMNVIAAWLIFSIGYMTGLPAEGGQSRFGEVRDIHATVTHVAPASPAEHAGFKAGDTVSAIASDGESIAGEEGSEAVRAFIASHAQSAQKVTVVRGGETLTLSATPESGIEEGRPVLGIGLSDLGILQLPPHTALLQAGALTYSVTKDTAVGLYTFFSGIFKGEADFSSVAGPVGLVGVVGDASALGLSALITLTALISINLAIINLIPFPALDGGRLVLIAIEAIRGVSLPARFISRYNIIGFLLLIGLMIAVTYNDIVRLLS